MADPRRAWCRRHRWPCRRAGDHDRCLPGWHRHAGACLAVMVRAAHTVERADRVFRHRKDPGDRCGQACALLDRAHPQKKRCSSCSASTAPRPKPQRPSGRNKSRKRWRQDSPRHPCRHSAVDPGAFVAPRLYVSDSTIERLAVLLQARPRGALLSPTSSPACSPTWALFGRIGSRVLARGLERQELRGGAAGPPSGLCRASSGRNGWRLSARQARSRLRGRQ